MMFKLIILLAAVVPVVLFVNRLFFRRSPKIQKAFAEFRRQVDFAAWALLGLAAIAIVYSLARFVYGFWT
jgi:hypothetical protein